MVLPSQMRDAQWHCERLIPNGHPVIRQPPAELWSVLDGDIVGLERFGDVAAALDLELQAERVLRAVSGHSRPFWTCGVY